MVFNYIGCGTYVDYIGWYLWLPIKRFPTTKLRTTKS